MKKEIKKAWVISNLDEIENGHRFKMSFFYGATVGQAKSNALQELMYSELIGSGDFVTYKDIKLVRCKERDVFLHEGIERTRDEFERIQAALKRTKNIKAIAEGNYYIQDRRQYVGNSMLWWAKDSKGYTTNIEKAQVFSKEEIANQSFRETDIIWPESEVKKGIKQHVDMQCLNIENSI